MNLILLWIILSGTVLILVFSVVILITFIRISHESGQELRDELRKEREETGRVEKEFREESASWFRMTNDTLSSGLENIGRNLQGSLEVMTRQLNDMTESNRNALDRMRTRLDEKMIYLQESNEKKLEEIRRTVDEKLNDTLEKRLGESFRLVSERLEAVHKGLGEMQNLATGVGDLKRVLSNVKVRGTWGEVQLGAILEQILAPSQYARSVQVKQNSMERVDFAVKLPGSRKEPDSFIWLPIDSKFPKEDYLRIQDAAERADSAAVRSASDAFGRAVKNAAKDIRDKYINPPATTDFAILFLATEGLYAEALRQPALAAEIQQDYRVVLAGPTTLVAVLNSIRMGFQTLAIEKRAVEVWKVLGAVKTEFRKFGDILAKVNRQLNTASRTIEQTEVRTRAMERKLRAVEQLPEKEASAILKLPLSEADDAEKPTNSDSSDEGDLKVT